jgi:hypothetical protein
MNDAPDLNVGAPGTIDALFCRDFVAEQVTPTHFAKVPGAVTEPTTDKIIKSMINFELHGLMDCAVELAEHFRPPLSHRLDVDTAIAQLMHRPPSARNTADVRECLRMIGEVRTLVFQQEGAERDAAVARICELQSRLEAHQQAYSARIMELQSRLERFEQSHADAMSEASRVHAAERAAAVVRISELQSQLERFEQSHADAMAEASRVHAAEREAAIVRIRELEAQQRAYVAQIMELVKNRGSIPPAIRRVARLLPGGRRIVGE